MIPLLFFALCTKNQKQKNISSGETSSLAQNQRFRFQLSAVVKRHNAIIDLCSDFTTNFTLIILMHFLSAALVLCSSILDLMLVSCTS